MEIKTESTRDRTLRINNTLASEPLHDELRFNTILNMVSIEYLEEMHQMLLELTNRESDYR